MEEVGGCGGVGVHPGHLKPAEQVLVVVEAERVVGHLTDQVRLAVLLGKPRGVVHLLQREVLLEFQKHVRGC